MADQRSPLIITRRSLLIAGSALAVAACTTSGRQPVEAPRRDPDMARGKGFWYTVQAGEDVPAVAKKAQLGISDVVVANGLTSLSLSTGQQLWLPGIDELPDAPAPEVLGPPEPTEELPAQGYRLVPRSAWTKEPIAGNNTPMGKVLRITVHHTGEHAGLAGLPDIEVVRRIERYHRNPRPSGRGWACIGYHYLVGKDGRVYEGRPARYQGAHVSSANENNLGISVIGDFQRHAPSKPQLATLKAVVEDMQKRYAVSDRKVFGHRDVGHSECPGDFLYAWLQNQGFTKKPG